MTSDRKTHELAAAGIIAAFYVALTLLSNAAGLANGMVQIRISEALCVLPVVTGAAVPGLFVGCLAANLLTGCALWDVLGGALATLLGAWMTRKLRDRKFLRLLPPVLTNTLVVPVLLAKVYGITAAWPVLAAGVFAGEAVSCAVLGGIVLRILEKNRKLMKL